jgi:hypothetical protein
MNRDEFIEQYTAFAERALKLATKARREGILSLERDIDQQKVNERDIFEYGLSFVVDGTERSIIEKILGNIVTQEKDDYTLFYKTIQMEAALEIQQGTNPKMLYFILNSFTDIPLKDDKAYTDDSKHHDEEEDNSPEENNDIIEDTELAENVVVFNDIARLRNRTIQIILREVDHHELIVALKAANEEARSKIFRNISKRAVAMIKQDMEYMGPVRRNDAEEAQQKIIGIIKSLVDNDEIS